MWSNVNKELSYLEPVCKLEKCYWFRSSTWPGPVRIQSACIKTEQFQTLCKWCYHDFHGFPAKRGRGVCVFVWQICINREEITVKYSRLPVSLLFYDLLYIISRYNIPQISYVPKSLKYLSHNYALFYIIHFHTRGREFKVTWNIFKDGHPEISTRFNYHSDLSKRLLSNPRYLLLHLVWKRSTGTCLSESGAATSQRKSEDIAGHGKLTFEEINILPQARKGQRFHRECGRPLGEEEVDTCYTYTNLLPCIVSWFQLQYPRNNLVYG